LPRHFAGRAHGSHGSIPDANQAVGLEHGLAAPSSPAVMKREENPEILLGRKLMELRKKISATFDLPEATPIFHVLDIPSGNLT